MIDQKAEKIKLRQTVPIDLELLAEAKKRLKRLGLRSFGEYCNMLITRDLASGEHTAPPGRKQDLDALASEEAEWVELILEALRRDFPAKQQILEAVRTLLESSLAFTRRAKQTKAR